MALINDEVQPVGVRLVVKTRSLHERQDRVLDLMHALELELQRLSQDQESWQLTADVAVEQGVAMAFSNELMAGTTVNHLRLRRFISQLESKFSNLKDIELLRTEDAMAKLGEAAKKERGNERS